MNRWVCLLCSLGLLVLAPASGRATQPAGDTPEDTKLAIEALRKQIDDLKRTRDLDYRLLSDRLDRMEKLLERIAAGQTGSSKSAFTPVAPAPESPRGLIRLDNRLPVTGFVTIDGITYRVPPLATRTLQSIPVGPISYTLSGEGMGTGPLTRSRVNAGELLTITLLPPQ
ncbi:MAG: hypothetical protein SNJ75_07275 [Gemmataceae bacterium]